MSYSFERVNDVSAKGVDRKGVGEAKYAPPFISDSFPFSFSPVLLLLLYLSPVSPPCVRAFSNSLRLTLLATSTNSRQNRGSMDRLLKRVLCDNCVFLVPCVLVNSLFVEVSPVNCPNIALFVKSIHCVVWGNITEQCLRHHITCSVYSFWRSVTTVAITS